MKTLYISDLDGTLLNKNAEVTPYTREVINRFTESGGYFTTATARSTDTALRILDGVRLTAPAILLNGVSVYDTRAQKYDKIETIDRACLTGLFRTLDDFGITGFVNGLENGEITYYYENLDAEHRKAFHDERSHTYGRVYTRTDSFAALNDRGLDIVYFSACGDYETFVPVYEKLRTDSRIRVEFYRDVYHERFWYLEVCSAAASKYNAATYLKKTYGFDRVIAFGDNMNDLPLFRASDECYAVANAKEEVKEKAAAVIGSNDNDGVAKWFEKIFFS